MKKQKQKLNQKISMRILFFRVLFIALFLLVAGQAFMIQIVGKEKWRHQAKKQHSRIINLPRQRGVIYDANGVEMAASYEVDSIFVDPERVERPHELSQKLADALSLSAFDILKKVQQPKRFVWIKRHISQQERAQVQALNLQGEGAYFVKEPKRFYPNSRIGGHIIGFTGIDPVGLEGLERSHNSTLLGEKLKIVSGRDGRGKSLTGQNRPRAKHSRHNNLHLTIDRDLQYIAEKELAEGVKKAKAKSGTAIVMDPSTGAVLAMANVPDYDPNRFKEHKPYQWRNRAIHDMFEPGSTFKSILLAASLNEKSVNLDTVLNCENGAYRIRGGTIHDHHPHKRITVAETLKYSSNIGFVKIGEKLGKETYHRYIKDFGFGQKTEIELPGERRGLVRNPKRWYPIDLANISFGQGIAVTPLQLTSAIAALANNGQLMKPYIVKKITNEFGETIEETQPTMVRQVVSAEVARQVIDTMTLVTEKGGTGTRGKIPGYKVAGKTGTAQKADFINGGYCPKKRIGSFVGVVPADNPRFAVFVMIDEPEGTSYGGVVAAPVFARIASHFLHHQNLTPEQDTKQLD